MPEFGADRASAHVDPARSGASQKPDGDQGRGRLRQDEPGNPGAERLLALGHAVAWLSLDEDDNEPAQFLFYVANVLRQACDGLAKPAIG
jgi:hypothetical protein